MDSFWKLRGSYCSFLRVQEVGVKSFQEEEAADEAAELWELQRAGGTLVLVALFQTFLRRALMEVLAQAAAPGLPLGLRGAVLQVHSP